VPGSTDSLISVDFAFVSYNLDGSLNASFGVGGKVDSHALTNRIGLDIKESLPH
jgi:hypothetical protein